MAPKMSFSELGLPLIKPIVPRHKQLSKLAHLVTILLGFSLPGYKGQLIWQLVYKQKLLNVIANSFRTCFGERSGD